MIHPPPVVKSTHPGVPGTPWVGWTRRLPPIGEVNPASDEHDMELETLSTRICVPSVVVRSSAFTVMPEEVGVCSFIMRSRTPGMLNSWFGSPVTEIVCPPATRFPSSADPLAPSQVAIAWAIPKSESTSAGVPGRSTTSPVAAWLSACCPTPRTEDVSMSELAGMSGPQTSGRSTTLPMRQGWRRRTTGMLGDWIWRALSRFRCRSVCPQRRG